MGGIAKGIGGIGKKIAGGALKGVLGGGGGGGAAGKIGQLGKGGKGGKGKKAKLMEIIAKLLNQAKGPGGQ